jgi:hypothetical protein
MAKASFQHWLAFCVGKRADHHGRYIGDIWRYSHDQLEMRHDYIQWLFVTRNRATDHSEAPIWDEEVWQSIENKAEIISSVNRSVLTMLRYWGIDYSDKHFHLSQRNYERQKLWLSKHNHNQQRITRMLSALVLIGEPKIAQELNRFLRISATRHGVQPDSVQY